MLFSLQNGIGTLNDEASYYDNIQGIKVKR